MRRIGAIVGGRVPLRGAMQERPPPTFAEAPLEPAHGGRLPRAVVLELFTVPLVELAEAPQGLARDPVVLPCAPQTRELFPPADGARFCETLFCRPVVPAFAGCPVVRPFVFIE